MAKTLLEAVNIEVRRGMGVVLSNHNLVAKQGDVVVLEGANGSGKSTLIEAIARLLPLEKGHVNHGEMLVVDHEGRRKPSPLNVSLALQKNGALGSERVKEHLEIAMKMAGQSLDFSPFLDAFSLTHRANDCISNLSQGQARKVAVLAALLPAFASSNPSIVLMDEPDAGLDESSIEALCGCINELRKAGHCLVISTHDERVKDCATTKHHLPSGRNTPCEPQQKGDTSSHSTSPQSPVSPSRFGLTMQWRTLAWLNQNAMAALLTLGILMAMGPWTGSLTELQQLGFILAPALAAGLCGDAMVAMCREERTNAWWRAVSTGPPHSGVLPFLLGAVVTMASNFALVSEFSAINMFVGALLTGITSHVLRLAHQSTERLARPQAVFIGLLTPVLILPYALLLDMLTR